MNFPHVISKQNTVYEGDYHDRHPNIVTFWEVFENLTAEEKKKLFRKYHKWLTSFITFQVESLSVLASLVFYEVVFNWFKILYLLSVFVTGSYRVPFLGMESIQMKVAVLPDSTDIHKPESLTCHRLLLLPVYQRYLAERTMHTRLLQAINHNRGFCKKADITEWSNEVRIITI